MIILRAGRYSRGWVVCSITAVHTLYMYMYLRIPVSRGLYSRNKASSVSKTSAGERNSRQREKHSTRLRIGTPWNSRH